MRFFKKILPIISLFYLHFAFAQNTAIHWNKHIISDSLSGAKKNMVLNLDNDENANMDIVVTANPESGATEDTTLANVIWFKNTGEEIFEQVVLDYKFIGARGLAAGDLDGDGFEDIISGSRQSDSSLVWYRNPGSALGVWQRTKIGGPAPNDYAIYVTDMDNDGRLDIIDGIGDDANYGSAGGGSFTDSLRWLKNIVDGSGMHFEAQLIAQYPSPAGIAVTDFDADGRIDVAAASWLDYGNLTASKDEDVRWWRQGADTVFTQRQVLQQYYGGNSLTAADVDGDGDADLLGAGYKNQSLDWWANDGSGTFGAGQTIAADFIYARNVAAADIDGDGDMDVAGAADNANTVAWFENDGQQQFTQHKVDTLFTYAYFVTPADLDGDGDVDLIGTAQDAGELAWWESDLAEEKIVPAGDPDSLFFNDSLLIVDYEAGYSGGNTSAFYNYGINWNSSSLGSGVKQIADSGFYTIHSKATSYSAMLIFDYGQMPQWQNVAPDENDLRICYWDETSDRWLVLGDSGQIVDQQNKRIIVPAVNAHLQKYSRFTLADAGAPSAIEIKAPPVNNFTLKQNYPNPFNPQTIINYELGIRNFVEINIYNLLGEKVITLVNRIQPSGRYHILWDGRNGAGQKVASGSYVYELRVGHEYLRRKMQLVR